MRRLGSRVLRRLGEYLAAAAVLLAGWEVLARALATPALPGPGPALADFVRLFPGALAPHLAVSGARVVASMALGAGLAAPLGLVLGRSPRADRVLAPLVFLTYPIPKVVLLPVFLTVLGIGNASKIGLIATIVFFQILVTARGAARNIPEASVVSVRSLGAGRWQVFRHVVVPAALPDVFTALRIGTGTAVAVLFFCESVAGSSGLGYYILDAWGRIAASEMFAGVLAMALLGVGLYESLEVLEARLCRWTRAGR